MGTGADRTDRVAARESAEVDAVRRSAAPSSSWCASSRARASDDALEALRDDPAVRVASRDGYSAPNAIPDDPLFGELWGLQNLGSGIDGFAGAVAGVDIDAPAAWDRTVGSPSIVIADLDSGYRFDSPDLGPVAWTNPAELAGRRSTTTATGSSTTRMAPTSSAPRPTAPRSTATRPTTT